MRVPWGYYFVKGFAYLLCTVVMLILAGASVLLAVPAAVMYLHSGRNIISELLGKPYLKVKLVLMMIRSVDDEEGGDHE